MYGGKRIRTTILSSEKSAFDYTKRKTRCNALSNNVKKTVFNFWLQPEMSRATNNKNDVKRARLAPKMYSSHACHIFEKTQSEVYNEFKSTHPDIKIGQRSFEKLKPYFVRPASFKDKSTCCCRLHVETRSLFRTCMAYRRAIVSQTDREAKIYENLTELVNDTLCPISANTHQHKNSCLSRNCEDCGVKLFELLPEETSLESDEATWECYEYQVVKNKDGGEMRKLVLVKRKTPPFHMFEFFKTLLQTFPSHQFHANWQTKQLKNITNNFPTGQCVLVHDYSENYKCSAKQELQSSYFQKIEVSLHVSVLHRHARIDVDGMESTEDEPKTVTEHFFVISPETRYDHHFTHEVQQLITEYLQSVDGSIDTLHEFIDGCSCQYKSCHCLGDLSNSCQDLGMKKVIRNYFETSYGRGPQDAAGGYVKKMADLAVLRGTHVIQTPDDMFKYASENMENTKEQAICSRRVFRFLPSVDRNRPDRIFVPVKENRKIHQVINETPGILKSRNLSCYDCDKCLSGEYSNCTNDIVLGSSKELQMKPLNQASTTDVCDTSIIDNQPMNDLVCAGTLFAVRADDEVYPYYMVRASSSVTILRKQLTDKKNLM